MKKQSILFTAYQGDNYPDISNHAHTANFLDSSGVAYEIVNVNKNALSVPFFMIDARHEKYALAVAKRFGRRSIYFIDKVKGYHIIDVLSEKMSYQGKVVAVEGDTPNRYIEYKDKLLTVTHWKE